MKPYRDFGFGLTIVLCVFGMFAWRRGVAPWPWLGAAAAALAAALATPAAYRPVYAVWMPLARALGRVNSFLLLGLLYYLVLTPYAWLARVFGARFLEFGPTRRDSHWRPAAKRDPAVALRQQF